MRLIISLILFLFFCRAVEAQQDKDFRSDTLNFSIQVRYFIGTFGAGVEFPFRQHSFGLQLGYNAVPVDGNIYLGLNLEKIGALEYKRYVQRKLNFANQFYYGSYLIFKNTEHASPHDEDYYGDWYKSESINIGPMVGCKWYWGKRAYGELFLGFHGGWQWGDLRWDNRDLSGERHPSYQQANKIAYGLRLGLSIGFHPTKKDREGN